MKSHSHQIVHLFIVLLVVCIPMAAMGQNGMSVEQCIQTGENALNQGELKIAEQSFRQAIDAATRLGQDDNRILATMKLKGLLRRQGRYEEAIPLAMSLCEFLEKTGNFDLDSKLFEYSELAIMLGNTGAEKDALSCLGLVMAVAKQIKTPFAYGMFNNTAGIVHGSLVRWNKAVKYYISAGDCFSHSIDPRAASINEDVLPLLAAAYYQDGDFDKSYESYKILATQRAEKEGVNSRKYADAVRWLANIEGYKGLLDDAKNHYIESWNILSKIVAQDLALLPPNSRGEYWKDVNDAMWNMVPFALAAGYNEDDFTSMAYESLMFSKGLLLSLEKSTKSIVEQTQNQELMSDYMEIANIRNHIAKLQASNQRMDASLAYAKMDSLDHAFSIKLQHSGIVSPVSIVNKQDIIANLEKGEAIVDFVDFTKKDGSHVYAAFIVNSRMKHPRLIKVFEQSRIDSLLASNNGRYSDLYKDANQKAMCKIIWNSLLKEIKGMKTVFFIPSGILNQIAVEAIKLPNGKYAGDEYNMVRLSNSKELAKYKQESANLKLGTARVYGGLEYNVASDVMAAEASAYDIPPLYALRGTETLKAKEVFLRLRMSADEVIEIADILAQNNMIVEKFMDTKGTEESFVSMSGNSPDLLLVSTHGFYYSPKDVPSWSSLNGYDNPMYLTGLVMSGGNAEYLGKDLPDGVLGGLLTSSDISQLDLTKTQLVVLSACETALGETTNEGVYGLQRAFKKAGAATLVMSLWSVSDVATKDFMVMFHKELSGNGWNKRKAFNKAQKDMRQKYSDPYYWAAFIMID